ncbi:hypothetical protein [Cellulophaga sp. Hel_I_12]|uniref:hypothetical protein n=1 Tax=Cellulophaga sp. Hel_I_12 TaxID=1249972 RepID=UPI000AA00755|nr:hypothetical protein [Cellulophaga sp. Hel_I_12]
MGIFDFLKKRGNSKNDKKLEEEGFKTLIEYLEKVPSLKKPISFNLEDNGFWWVKFKLDIKHPLVWNVIQELGCIVNYISVNERLPTVFYPVSPAPYLNGSPEDYLSWVIETKNTEFKPEILLKYLIERLPSPVNDLQEWQIE